MNTKLGEIALDYERSLMSRDNFKKLYLYFHKIYGY